jgi:hypothetical protein
MSREGLEALKLMTTPKIHINFLIRTLLDIVHFIRGPNMRAGTILSSRSKAHMWTISIKAVLVGYSSGNEVLPAKMLIAAAPDLCKLR